MKDGEVEQVTGAWAVEMFVLWAGGERRDRARPGALRRDVRPLRSGFSISGKRRRRRRDEWGGSRKGWRGERELCGEALITCEGEPRRAGDEIDLEHFGMDLEPLSHPPLLSSWIGSGFSVRLS